MVNELPYALKTFRQEFDVRVFVDRNSGGWHMPMEWHTSLEVFMCTNGAGRYYIGDKVYEFEEGDIFVIGNNELHKSEILENGGFDAFIIMFAPDGFLSNRYIKGKDLLDIFYGRTDHFCHKYSPSQEKRQIYESVSSIILKEYEEKKENYVTGVSALVTWFLIELNRAYNVDGDLEITYETNERLKHKKIISEVLNFVEENYKSDISLKELADKLYVNQAYLSREFKKNTGYSMMKFITNKRIREARELLRNSDISISEVAITVGYNNITHFHTMFKKEIGISPKEFRKQIRGTGQG
ncbi:AraC family transcriptional regulator [Robinsoniella peoriensis]